MRVLLVSSMFPPYCGGGVSSHVYDLAIALRERGHSVRVLSSRRGKEPDQDENRVQLDGIDVQYSKSYPSMFLDFLRLLKNEHFDVYHFHSFNAGLLGILQTLSARKSFLLTVHSDTANFFASTRNWSKLNPLYLFLRLTEILVAKSIGNIIAVDERLKEYAFRLGVKRVWKIGNSVDTDYFSPIGGIAGGSENEFLILCPRMLVPKNGVIYALKSINLLPYMPGGIRLLIAGDGPLRSELQREADEIGKDRISFLGECDRDRMRTLYRNCDVVVIPSITSKGLQEATSISALEAMACGKPVIASNIGGLREIVIDGETGYLVEECKADAIAGRILQYLDDAGMKERMGKRAREVASEKFSRGNWILRIESVYEALMRMRSGSDSGNT